MNKDRNFVNAVLAKAQESKGKKKLTCSEAFELAKRFNVEVIEIGRICIKNVGREAGKRCVIVDLIDRNFVLITGPKSVSGIKRRRANIRHLNPVDEKIEIKRNASDEEVSVTLNLSVKDKEKNKS